MKLGMFTMPSHPPERSLKDGHDWDLQTIVWADELGFGEFWIGEHHAMVWEPHPAPDLLVVEVVGHGVHEMDVRVPGGLQVAGEVGDDAPQRGGGADVDGHEVLRVRLGVRRGSRGAGRSGRSGFLSSARG